MLCLGGIARCTFHFQAALCEYASGRGLLLDAQGLGMLASLFSNNVLAGEKDLAAAAMELGSVGFKTYSELPGCGPLSFQTRCTSKPALAAFQQHAAEMSAV